MFRLREKRRASFLKVEQAAPFQVNLQPYHILDVERVQSYLRKRTLEMSSQLTDGEHTF